jgi:hypothetical protein
MHCKSRLPLSTVKTGQVLRVKLLWKKRRLNMEVEVIEVASQISIHACLNGLQSPCGLSKSDEPSAHNLLMKMMSVPDEMSALSPSVLHQI